MSILQALISKEKSNIYLLVLYYGRFPMIYGKEMLYKMNYNAFNFNGLGEISRRSEYFKLFTLYF